MLRVFVDTSVLFAAVYSATGYARELVLLAAAGRIQLIVSEDVVREIERNLARKAPAALPALHDLFEAIDPLVIAVPSTAQIREAERYTEAKDAPIIAAALIAAPDYVVTYDQKHLLLRPGVAQESGLQIVTPDVVVQRIRAE